MKGAIAGVLAAGFGVAAAELLAAVTRPAAGPLVAVGGAVVDATPAAVKELAIRELGTHDKPALLTGIAVVVALVAAAAGALGRRRRWVIPAGAGLLGLAGVAAALSRPASVPFDAVPALLAAAVAGLVLWSLTRPSLTGASSTFSSAGPTGTPAPMRSLERRRFLRAAALVAAGAVAAEGGATLVKRSRGDAAARSREAIRLPAAADPAPPLPAGVAPGFRTANTAFYRVDTALTVPRIDPDAWSLRVHGMVGRELRLSLADLLRRPLIERDVTLNCVSNEVGGPYVGTARWLGVPLAPLLREAGVAAAADQLVARSVDGMTIGTPVATALDGRDTMLVVGMNGEPLPLEHGFPVRMLTPGLYGYAGACKWLTELELTRFDRFDAYWVKRGWAADGPVKTASRIDRPRPFDRLPAGRVTVAGVAWAQHRGIRAVEVSVDGGAWARAELLPVPSADTWVQWRYSWTATAGPHSISVRATDGTGAVQPAARATPFPSGATGRHTISVTVT
ncbi:molybdopterin-dependent oxidoreductase [Actinoplanes sp. CA-030573]|uniref:molybdopterin-dependent oxidoreductase n=1 Tax=Actinoplanes sp. CA-030573 TaxID=3239898 RepID=UPI003D8EECE1